MRPIQGIVLAGGKSSRFGSNKALAKWRGKTLLERAADLLMILGLRPAIISNFDYDYSFLGCRVARDIIPEKGPLGGLYTACSLFPKTSLLVLTCDMPLLTEPVLKQLIESHAVSAQATIFGTKEKIRPFPGIYAAELKTLLEGCLGSNELSMKAFLSCVSGKQMLGEFCESRVFWNINQPVDLMF